MPTLTPRIIAALVLLGLAVLLLAFGPAACTKWRSERAQSRVDQAQAQAAGTSANEAGHTQATVNANEVASEALGRSNEQEIRNAQGSDAVVAAPARDAGIASLCRRASYRNTERCRLLNAR